MDLDQTSTLVRILLLCYTLFPRTHAFFNIIIYKKGVYGALYVVGIVATVYGIGELVVVRICLFMRDSNLFKVYFFYRARKLNRWFYKVEHDHGY